MLAYRGGDLYIEKMHESLPNNFPFPRAIGNEEETGMIVGIDGDYDEPYDLCTNLSEYIPDRLKAYGQSNFLTNGSKLYIGGTDEEAPYETNLERATPETISPWQLTEYSRGSELLIESILKKYTEVQAVQNNHDIDIRMHRRVVDAKGNRKACHDNYGLEKQFADKYDVPQSLIYLLAARSLIVGAGLVTQDGYQYSQKINGLKQVSGYGYFGTMYRLDIEHGERLEVRCGDQNVSDWATTMRVGSVALVLALNQTPLSKKIEEAVPVRNREDSMKYHARELNEVLVPSEDEFFLSKTQIQAIDFIKQVAELTMDQLQLYADLPIEYHSIARELYDFCEDYRRVGRGELSVSALADRADWAAKLSIIQKTIAKDNGFGIHRELGDYASQAQDMQYDMIRFSRNAEDSETKIVYGTGMRLRQKGAFRHTVSDVVANKAFHIAPKETRAHARAYLLQNYFSRRCDWHRVSIGDEDYDTIELLEVHNPDLGPYNEDVLSGQKKIER